MRKIQSVSFIHRQLRKGKGGTFRPLKVGEEILGSDIAVSDSFVESPSETSIGQPATEKDRIIRLEFVV